MKQSLFICALLIVMSACTRNQSQEKDPGSKIPVILDTDANNELDDQHALAYLLLNDDFFDIKGITVNTTRSGGNIDEQYAEAERVIQLCGWENKTPLLKGANGSFDQIASTLGNPEFDGSKAVNFIIEQAKKSSNKKLVVIAVGKLTNVALAVKKEPAIIKHVRLVWLGSNYPEPGEYNLMNDIPSMNYLLGTGIDFEMVTVRYGKDSGTDAVRVTKEDAMNNMPGLGPRITKAVTGRHGGSFYNFGDYSANLFEHIKYHGNPPSRALFDMAAVAIVKNPDWADSAKIPCPKMIDKKWVEQKDNSRKITIWENFNKEKILEDFYLSLKQ